MERFWVHNKAGGRKKNIRAVLLLFLLLCAVSGCGAKETADAQAEKTETEEKARKTKGEETSAAQGEETSAAQEDAPGEAGQEDLTADDAEPACLIDSEGVTLESRVKTPEGYARKPADSNSLCAFLRGYALKENGSPVLLYNGK